MDGCKEKCIVSGTEKGSSKAEEISDKISEATEIHDVKKISLETDRCLLAPQKFWIFQ